MSTLEIRRLRAFGHQVRSDSIRDMKFLRGRDLNLLRDIETTLNELDVEQERVNQLNTAAIEFINILNSYSGNLPTETGLVDILDKARDTIGNVHNWMCARLSHARSDVRLDEDDGIVAAFERLTESTSKLHNNLNKLSWVVGELEADGDESMSEAYGSSEELFAALGV